jgi:hypothetical protein
VRVSGEIDLATIPSNHFKMLHILERLCRDRSYCWPSNAKLAALYGCVNSGGFRQLLAEMERDGFISRQPIQPGRPGAGRLGIFLHVRLDRDLPVETGPPPPPEAVKRLRNSRERFDLSGPKSAGQGASQGADTLPQNGQGGLPQNGQQNKDRSRKKDESNQEEKRATPQRQRPEDIAEAIPARTEAIAVKAPTTAPEPSTAQVAVLVDQPLADRLAQPQAALDTGPPAATSLPRRKLRCEVVRAEAPVDDPIIAAELARRAQPRPAAPPELPPQDTAELIRQLPRAESHWVQIAVENLVQRFGSAMDRNLWGQFHLILLDVWRGRLDPEVVVSAYEQAMKPASRNAGAVFWTALRREAGLGGS